MAAKAKVLVAEDEATVAAVVMEVLGDAGFDVRHARDGREAVEMIGAERFDVVLTDIRMPGMSGVELLREIKRTTPRTAVVIMTSHASLETSLEAIRLGAYDYILKPFPEVGAVANMVRRAAESVGMLDQNDELIRNLRGANARLAESNELLAARATTIATLFDYAHELSGVHTREKFAEATARACSTLAGGRAAVYYRLDHQTSELFPAGASGIDVSSMRRVTPDLEILDAASLRRWLRGLSELPSFPVDAIGKPGSAWVMPVDVGKHVIGAAVAFESISPFPPSVGAVLEKFRAQMCQCAENIEMHETMRALAIRDGLTGLYNHRYFKDRIAEEFARSRRHGNPLSLVFIDVDHFKKFNDEHGHPAGDALLRSLAALVRSGRRSDVAARLVPEGGEVLFMPGRDSDIAARYGGEEFVVILIETPLAGARVRAERLRKTIAENPFVLVEGGAAVHATVSIGVAEIREHGTSDELIQDADRAMYAAKRGGRNRVCTVDDAADSGSGGGAAG